MKWKAQIKGDKVDTGLACTRILVTKGDFGLSASPTDIHYIRKFPVKNAAGELMYRAFPSQANEEIDKRNTFRIQGGAFVVYKTISDKAETPRDAGNVREDLIRLDLS